MSVEDCNELDSARREIATTLLAAAGLVGLASCSQTDADVATQQLSGTVAITYCEIQSDLKRLVPSAATQVVVLGGYYAVGDGGGGIFYWTTATTGLINDGGLVVIPKAGGGAWVRQFSGPISARWFGAGLGVVADDAVPIQAAIGAALRNGAPWTGGKTAPGGVVLLPAGSYVLAQPIRIDSTYAQGHPQWVPSISVRLIGEGMFNTYVYKTGTDSTCIVFGGTPSASGAPPADRIHDCEVSNLTFIWQDLAHPPTSGAVISFPYAATTSGHGGGGVLLQHLTMWNCYRGIQCALGPANGFFNNVTVSDVKMSEVLNCGLYASYALDWRVSNSYFTMVEATPKVVPPLAQTPYSVHAWEQGTYAMWLDSYTTGWTATNNFFALGDACMRLTNSFGTVPPSDHRFRECNYDEGGRACIWATSATNCSFFGCYASSQSSQFDQGWVLTNPLTLTGVFVADGSEVRRLLWSHGTMINSSTVCFNIYAAVESFSIVNSTFSSWGITAPNFYSAISVVTWSNMNFTITGNSFINDPYFSGNPWRGIDIGSPAQAANKYIIANNLGYGTYGPGSLSGGTLNDGGVASYAKYLPIPNSNV